MAVLKEDSILNPYCEELSPFSLKIVTDSDDELVVDITGITAAMANAIRRILIAEVPTMAIERVDLYQNTSVLNDEILAHRLGLIPLKVDPRGFDDAVPDEDDEKTTLQFKLHVKCYKDPDGNIINQDIYTSALEWIPMGTQAQTLGSVAPVSPDILIVKLGVGQEIEADLFAVKGIGQTHAKWSPVCTASYRLLPKVTVPADIKPAKAKKLVEVCPLKVFDLENAGGLVARPRDCTSCRECIRDGEYGVTLGKQTDYYIFTIESTGVLPSRELLKIALQILRDKCSGYHDRLQTPLVAKF